MAVYTGEDDITATIHYSSYSFDENKIDIEFLNYFLKSIEFKNALKEQVPGGIKTEIKPKHLLPLEVIIPTDIKDQRAVVKILQNRNSNVSELSTELTHQLSLVKKLRQQLLQDAVQGKLTAEFRSSHPELVEGSNSASELLKKIKAERLRHAELVSASKGKTPKQVRGDKTLPPIKPEDIPFEIPENWMWCRLGEICNTITKGSSPNWQGVQYVEEGKGILYITSKNVDSFTINLTKATFVEEKFNEIEPRSILKKGDILTNIVGASIGRTALFNLDVVANINQAVCILRIEHDYIYKDYLLNFMNSDLVLKMMSDSQFAPGRANLSMSNIASFTIPLPPLSEQNLIVQKLEQLMQMCNELEESIKQSTAQNEKLLQQVLREALRN
jgi:type I restriction enzyme S subunit